MITCLYHYDHDGHTAGAIVRRKFPDVNLIEMNYGRDIPWDDINQSDMVIIVDYSLSIEDMQKIDSERKFVWIDHHKSIIEDADKANFHPEGIRFIGKSGCRLAWEYYFPDEEIPVIIDYMANYDIFDFSDVENKMDSKALIFEYGMRLYNTDPNNGELWNTIFNNDPDTINRIYHDGKVIWQYQQIIDEDYLKDHAFEATFDGKPALVINLGRSGSLAFERLWDNTKYDLMVGFCINGDGISVSLYTDKDGIDVSKIAYKFDGGGHEQASGLTFDSVQPFFKLMKLSNVKMIDRK